MTTKENVPNIINPEIPETQEGKRELLDKCMAVLAIEGGTVEGVSPHHVSQEGMLMIMGRQKAARPNTEL